MGYGLSCYIVLDEKLAVCFLRKQVLFYYSEYRQTTASRQKSEVANFLLITLFQGSRLKFQMPTDCRTRGREFKPSPIPYFAEIDHELTSTVILLLQLIKRGLLSVTSESMCTGQDCTGKCVVM